MSIIESIEVKEYITQVNVYNMPADACLFSQIFRLLKQNKVNVDMICRPVTYSSTTVLSFTFDDKDFKTVIAVLNKLKQSYEQMKFSFSASNCKIIVYGEKLRDTAGIASDVFDTVCNENVDILLISTAETEISMLVSGHDCDKAMCALTERFI